MAARLTDDDDTEMDREPLACIVDDAFDRCTDIDDRTTTGHRCIVEDCCRRRYFHRLVDRDVAVVGYGHGYGHNDVERFGFQRDRLEPLLGAELVVLQVVQLELLLGAGLVVLLVVQLELLLEAELVVQQVVQLELLLLDTELKMVLLHHEPVEILSIREAEVEVHHQTRAIS